MKNNTLPDTFEKCANESRTALVVYVTAGDPDFNLSLKICEAIAGAGADILELGVPFSDPLADGEANQLAAERAIKSGMTQMKVLELASKIRNRHKKLPLVLFTYLNPVAYSGKVTFKEFCKKAVSSGVDAILPLDLPPEEAEGEMIATIEDSGLKIVALVTPNTPEKRIGRLVSMASAFIYYVSREGVTGESKDFSANFAKKIELIKKYTDLPVVVGFGISTPEHVRAASSTGVDGVVVGSAIVRKIEALSKGKGSIGGIAEFVKKLSSATGFRRT